MRISVELERIAEQGDRSATFELVRRLTDPDIGGLERDQIASVLRRLGDPKAVPSLTAVVLDRGVVSEIRWAASEVLDSYTLRPGVAERRVWWKSGDDLVRGWVLRQGERCATDLLEPVVRDPHHLLYRDALRGIEFEFEEPQWQQYKIRGLDHPDPGVRATAAGVLCWDEPVAAEPALHRAATDDNTDVACTAIATLGYYRSRATLLLLHEIAHGDDERAIAAQDSKYFMLGDFEDKQLSIRNWIAPVADLLGPPEPSLESSFVQPAHARRNEPVPSAAEFIAAYTDLDGAWTAKLEMLRHYDWTGVPAVDRPAIASFMSSHPDPAVRARSCRTLSAWHEVDSLLGLVDDPDPFVRKCAVYDLRSVPPSYEIATVIWNLVVSGEIASTCGQEALASCAAHLPPRELDDRLIELARTDLRESIRAEALSQLGDRIEPLLPLLSDPPLITWAVHVRLLNACSRSGLPPPEADALRNVDNLQIAFALADFDD